MINLTYDYRFELDTLSDVKINKPKLLTRIVCSNCRFDGKCYELLNLNRRCDVTYDKLNL